MLVVAISAVMFSLIPWHGCRHSDHGYDWASKGASARRLERWARQQAGISRATAEDWRRKARGAGKFDRDRFQTAAKRHDEHVVEWEQAADCASRSATESFEISRKSGHKPSELPPWIRSEMKPEDLEE
jgi:hypothetical protein